MSMNEEELMIKVMEQKKFGADNFRGLVQIPIKALQLSHEPEWHYLSDAPAESKSSECSQVISICY